MTETESVPFAKLIKQLTVTELEDLREHIISVIEAIESVPKQFDSSFQAKINNILEIVSEIEVHSKNLKKEIENSTKSDTEKIIEKLLEGFKISSAEHSISGVKLIAFGILCSVLGGLTSGLLFYYLMS